jgi:predicted dehydrogenase
MAGETIRIGLLGAGGNTRLRHIPGFQAIDGVEVVAVCNRSEESGRRVADEFGIPNVATDPEQLFSDGSLDAICIGTWPYMHRAYSVRALEAGKHVLCEARMAMNASEAREMLEASQAHPELVAQVVPFPADLGVVRTIQRLAREELGEIREIHVTNFQRAALREGPVAWRERYDWSGMNTIWVGTAAEMLHRWVGPTESVLADATVFVKERIDEESGQPHQIRIPDSVGVLARMANGARAIHRQNSLAGHAAEPGGITLFGSEATLSWRQAGSQLSFAKFGDELQVIEPDPGTALGWRVEQDFIDSIREDAPVQFTSFEDGLRYMQFTEAVWRSWSEDRRVALSEV